MLINGLNIKQIRLSRGLSQQQFAEKLGVPKDRLAKWEQRNIVPKAEDFEKLQIFIRENVPLEDQMTNVVNEKDVKYGYKKDEVLTIEVDINKQISTMQEQLTQLMARANVRDIKDAEVRAKVFGTSLVAEISEFSKEVNTEVDRLFSELSKKQKV
jgi:transcriptional regulator with XRE-family HTH domain